MTKPKPITPITEKNGIQAIIFLQSLGGIVEPPEKAKYGWTNMSKHE